jgi:YD repeat-containing protein
MTDPTGTYSFTFDNMGRLTGATTSYAFLAGRNFTTAYSYDATSNRTGPTDPENGATSYAYDTLNRLQTLTPPADPFDGTFGFRTKGHGGNRGEFYDFSVQIPGSLNQFFGLNR